MISAQLLNLGVEFHLANRMLLLLQVEVHRDFNQDD